MFELNKKHWSTENELKGGKHRHDQYYLPWQYTCMAGQKQNFTSPIGCSHPWKPEQTVHSIDKATASQYVFHLSVPCAVFLRLARQCPLREMMWGWPGRVLQDSFISILWTVVLRGIRGFCGHLKFRVKGERIGKLRKAVTLIWEITLTFIKQYHTSSTMHQIH